MSKVNKSRGEAKVEIGGEEFLIKINHENIESLDEQLEDGVVKTTALSDGLSYKIKQQKNILNTVLALNGYDKVDVDGLFIKEGAVKFANIIRTLVGSYAIYSENYGKKSEATNKS